MPSTTSPSLSGKPRRMQWKPGARKGSRPPTSPAQAASSRKAVARFILGGACRASTSSTFCRDIALLPDDQQHAGGEQQQADDAPGPDVLPGDADQPEAVDHDRDDQLAGDHDSRQAAGAER